LTIPITRKGYRSRLKAGIANVNEIIIVGADPSVRP